MIISRLGKTRIGHAVCISSAYSTDKYIKIDIRSMLPFDHLNQPCILNLEAIIDSAVATATSTAVPTKSGKMGMHVTTVRFVASTLRAHVAQLNSP